MSVSLCSFHRFTIFVHFWPTSQPPATSYGLIMGRRLNHWFPHLVKSLFSWEAAQYGIHAFVAPCIRLCGLFGAVFEGVDARICDECIDHSKDAFTPVQPRRSSPVHTTYNHRWLGHKQAQLACCPPHSFGTVFCRSPSPKCLIRLAPIQPVSEADIRPLMLTWLQPSIFGSCGSKDSPIWLLGCNLGLFRPANH